MRHGIVVFARMLALTGVLLSPGQAGASNYNFTTIDAPGADNTFATGINNNGDIVGYYTYPPADSAGNEASKTFVLKNSSFSTIAYPGAYNTNGAGINESGVVVGYCFYEFYGTFGTCQRFYGVAQGWVYSGGSFSLVNFPGSISNATNAQGINKSGQIVGAYELPSGTVYGYILSGGSYTTINPPGSPGSGASGINDAGQIVGTFCISASCQHAGFLLSGIGGKFTTISVPGAFDTRAAGVNNLGDVVGYYDESASAPQKGFIWHSKLGTFDLFTDPLGVGGTVATGINDAGQVVGYYVDSKGVSHGFVASKAVPFAAGTPGLVVVDESSGSITFCPSAVSFGVPFGKCAGIGGLPTANLVGNAFVRISGLAALAGNLATGFVVECSLTYDASTGKPTGSCVPVANPIR